MPPWLIPRICRTSHSSCIERGAEKSRPDRFRGRMGAALVDDSGDDRLSRRSTIMGLAGLTAVFGMGTGVTPPVWSPEKRPAGGQARPGRSSIRWSVTHDMWQSSRSIHTRSGPYADHCPIAVLRLCGAASRSGWSSCSAVRTGRLRRSPAVHARPIDLVVFQEPSQPNAAGNLISEGASRLDAFSAYPVPTWLPGDAPSGTAGTPEVGPPQSSRTRGDSPQVSYAHGR